MKNKEPFDAKLYKRLVEQQRNIKSEKILNSIEKMAIDFTQSSVNKSIHRLLFDLKKYYNFVSAFWIYAISGDKNIFQYNEEGRLKQVDAAESERIKPDFQKIKEFFQKEERSQVASFTIIPSVYSFFTSEKMIKEFVDFLFKYLPSKNDKKDGKLKEFKQMCRVIFATPEFIKFCRYALAPLFASRRVEEEKIKEQFSNNARYLPELVHIFFKKLKKRNEEGCSPGVILYECFFKPLEERPILLILYGIIEAYEEPKKFIDLFEDLRKASECAADIIADTEIYVSPCISNTIVNNYPNVANQTVYSQLDFDVNDGETQNWIGFDKTQSYFIEKASYLKWIRIEDQKDCDEPTMCATGKGCALCLRHLLYESDNLPDIPMEEISVVEILEKMCVDRGPLDTYRARYNNFNKIKDKKLAGVIGNTTVIRDKARTNLSIFSNTLEKVENGIKEMVKYNEKHCYIQQSIDKKYQDKGENREESYQEIPKNVRSKYAIYDNMVRRFLSDEQILTGLKSYFGVSDLNKDLYSVFAEAAYKSDDTRKMLMFLDDIRAVMLDYNPELNDSDHLSKFSYMYIYPQCDNIITRFACIKNYFASSKNKNDSYERIIVKIAAFLKFLIPSSSSEASPLHDLICK